MPRRGPGEREAVSLGEGMTPLVPAGRPGDELGARVTAKADRWKVLEAGVRRFGWFPTSPFFAPVVGRSQTPRRLVLPAGTTA